MKSIASVRLRKRRKDACENGYTLKCIQRSVATVINCEKCNIGVFSYTNLRAKIVTFTCSYVVSVRKGFAWDRLCYLIVAPRIIIFL